MAGHLSESTSLGGKEKVAGRWRPGGVLGRLDVQDALDQIYLKLS
jgi:hypothetical protein